GDEGDEVGKSAWPDFHRSGDARHHPEHLHPKGREGRRRALQRRIPDFRRRQGCRQDKEMMSRETWSWLHARPCGGHSSRSVRRPEGRTRMAWIDLNKSGMTM